MLMLVLAETKQNINKTLHFTATHSSIEINLSIHVTMKML